MAEINHVCIKPGCGVKYKSEDPDPYYCKGCYQESKRIAKEIDAKLKPTKHVQKSGIQEYDEIRGNNPFPKASDLGIRF